MSENILERGIEKLEKEREEHRKSYLFGRFTQPEMTTIEDDNGDEHVIYDHGDRYELLPGRRKLREGDKNGP